MRKGWSVLMDTKEQIKKIKKIKDNFFLYAKNNLKIKNKDGDIVPLVLNTAQKELADEVLYCLATDKPIRILVLKARQMGLSTIIEAIIYWWTATHKNVNSYIIAHEDEASKNLYKMFKRYYDNSNMLFKPTRQYDTRTDLTFAKTDDEGNQVGLNSIIKTATAKNSGSGRSDTAQLVHGSEVAFWDNGEENVAALLQTVPLRPKTMVFLESTANGRGNYFAKEWANAAKGDSIFTTFFFPWWAHDEYELEGEEIGELSGYEKELIKTMKEGMKIGRSFYKVEDQEKIDKKIRYYRYKSLEFRTRPELLMQEYPSTPHEAFIASGASVFNSQALAELEKRCEETKTYELVDNTQREVSAAEDAFGKMKIWDMPVPGEEYVVGADVAEGLSTGDYSVADVIRKKDMKTVARYRGQVDPDQFGYILDKIGRFYNYALLGVEINNHGLAVVQRLRDLFYPNLYRRETRLDEVFEQATSKFGWKTTSVTKPLAIDYLAEAIREGHLDDRDIVFIEEAFSYVRDERGRMNAEEGTHDDTVMAKAIALQMWDWAVNNKEDLVVLNKGKTKVGKKRKKVIG